MSDQHSSNPIHYIIVDSYLSGLAGLAARVNDQIAKGYEPIGGLAYTGTKAAQAMIKRREGADVK